jgi:hypothetical protein
MRVRTESITKLLADPNSAHSFSARARRRRWSEFERRFPDIGEMSVIDLGGTSAYWTSSPTRPGSLTLLNLFSQEPPWADGTNVIVGSACEPPPELAGQKYDLVVSNSVIGSVGGHEMRRRFSGVVFQLGQHHWIQTPNRYFPIDPVFLFPLFAVLPFRARCAVSRRWPFGIRQAESYEAAAEYVLTLEFLTEAELRHYFPNDDIWRERFAGFTKSLVAIS